MDITIWIEQLREKIIQLCADDNISFRELSTELGYSTNYIQNIVSGKNLPSITGLFEICIYFSITPAEFFSCFENSDSASKNPSSSFNPTKLQRELMIEIVDVFNKKGIR